LEGQVQTQEYQKKLEGEVFSLRAHNESLSEEILSLKSQFEAGQSTILLLKTSLTHMENANAELRATVEERKIENSMLSEELNQLRCKAEHLQESNAEAWPQPEDFEGTNIVSEGEAIKSNPGSDESHGDVKDPVKSFYLNIEEDTERSTISSKPFPDDEEGQDDPEERFNRYCLETSVKSLEDENFELRKALEGYECLKKTIGMLECDKKNLLNEISDLQNQLCQGQLARSDSKQSLQEQQMESILLSTLAEQTTKDDVIHDLNEEREDLLRQLEDLRSQLREADATNASLKASLETQGDTIAEAQVGTTSSWQWDDAAHSDTQQNTPTASTEDLKKENSSLRDQVTLLQQKLQSLNETTIRSAPSAEESPSHHKTNNQESSSSKDKVALQERIQELESYICGLNKKIQDLSKLSSVQEESKDKVSSDEAQLKALQNEIENTKGWLEKSLDEVEELRGKVSSLTESLHEAEQNNMYLRIESERLESELFETKQTLAINIEEVEKLQDCVVEKQGNYEEAVQEIEALKAEIEDFWKAEVGQLKSSRSELEQRQKEREEKLKVAYKREVSQYKQRIEEFEKQVVAENQALRAEMESLQVGSFSPAEEVQRLNEALVAIRDEKAVLQGRLDDMEASRMEKLLLERQEQKEVDRLKAELSSERERVEECKEEIQGLQSSAEALEKRREHAVARAAELEASAKNNEKACELRKELDELQKELRRCKGAKVELEAFYMEKLHSIEEKHSLLLTELDSKKKEISRLRSVFCTDDDGRSREDLQMELKELNEKTIVQSRMIHALQKKVDTLEDQSKEKIFEKRREIMRDHSEQQNLRKENTRLRQKVLEVTRERKELQERLEGLANSLGSSMVSHLRKGRR
jgi:chromosome segregation ATPase